jgi:hypothetical protein
VASPTGLRGSWSDLQQVGTGHAMANRSGLGDISVNRVGIAERRRSRPQTRNGRGAALLVQKPPAVVDSRVLRIACAGRRRSMASLPPKLGVDADPRAEPGVKEKACPPQLYRGWQDSVQASRVSACAGTCVSQHDRLLVRAWIRREIAAPRATDFSPRYADIKAGPFSVSSSPLWRRRRDLRRSVSFLRPSR